MQPSRLSGPVHATAETILPHLQRRVAADHVTEDTLHTRFLTGLAAALLAVGCAVGVAGLHPAVANPAISRTGLLLILCSVPAWIVSEMRRAIWVSAEALADAHTAGYHLAVADLRGASTEAHSGGYSEYTRPVHLGSCGADTGGLRPVTSGAAAPRGPWWRRLAAWISAQQRPSKRS
jgi:hypothetical protein